MSLRQIITDIANMPVAINGAGPVRVEFLSTLKNRINEAELPHRKIRVFNEQEALPDNQYVFMSCLTSTLVYTDWSINDLFLYKGQAGGIGIAEYDDVLVTYADNYVAQLKAFVGTTDISKHEFQAFNASVGMFEFPEGSGQEYAGVSFNLIVREHLIP